MGKNNSIDFGKIEKGTLLLADVNGKIRVGIYKPLLFGLIDELCMLKTETDSYYFTFKKDIVYNLEVELENEFLDLASLNNGLFNPAQVDFIIKHMSKKKAGPINYSIEPNWRT